MRVPTAVGAKRTVKVVLPAGATGAVGLAVTVKSAALVPSMVIPIPVRSAEPELRIVKTRLALKPVATEPKATVALPSIRLVPAGCSTAISGAVTMPAPITTSSMAQLS
ncbi:MAG: hypothetical protein NTW21_35900 [Verrucomicrobia bacterium]|nr:hypothetical protein [Verrucomicrobiota bacterium]